MTLVFHSFITLAIFFTTGFALGYSMAFSIGQFITPDEEAMLKVSVAIGFSIGLVFAACAAWGLTLMDYSIIQQNPTG